MPVTLEICCGSADDAIQAALGGADRIELNSCLAQGGLTPSLGTLLTVKERIHLPVMAMVRPRGGGFCYTEGEMDCIRQDARLLLDAGADGLVFGFLQPNGQVDEHRTRELVALCGDKTSVFHRAIDVTPDWRQALEALIRLGVKRVLTSGQAATAPEGAQTLRAMQDFVSGAIEILPGAGVRLENATRLLSITGCNQLHLSCQRTVMDATAQNNRGIHFHATSAAPEDCYTMTDASYVAALRAAL